MGTDTDAGSGSSTGGPVGFDSVADLDSGGFDTGRPTTGLDTGGPITFTTSPDTGLDTGPVVLDTGFDDVLDTGFETETFETTSGGPGTTTSTSETSTSTTTATSGGTDSGGGTTDGGTTSGGTTDGGTTSGGSTEGGTTDGGSTDGGGDTTCLDAVDCVLACGGASFGCIGQCNDDLSPADNTAFNDLETCIIFACFFNGSCGFDFGSPECVACRVDGQLDPALLSCDDEAALCL